MKEWGQVKKVTGRRNSLRYAGNRRHFHLLEAKESKERKRRGGP